MKKLLTWAVAPVLMAAMVFVGCQKTIESVDGGRDVAMLSSGGGDCNIDCISENESSVATTGSTNFNNVSRTVSVSVVNTSTTVVYTVTSSEPLFYIELNGTTEYSSSVAATLPYVITKSIGTFGSDWEACDVVDGDFFFRRTNSNSNPNAQGNAVSLSVDHVLIGVCQPCDEAFSYVENVDGTITFSYTPDADYTGANVVFTFAQSADVSIDGFSASGATMQATLDLTACQTYTWTATINSLRCIGNGQNTVNAWTDFKVNEDSKKNDDTPNIERPCAD